MWLLTQQIFDRMEAAASAGEVPTAQEQAEYEREVQPVAGELPRGMSVAGGVAAIDIKGVLTDAPDLFARWFGGGNTTYAGIKTALAAAEADPEIKSIDFDVDSPGGQASSDWLSAMEAIAGTTKPTRMVVRGLAASAAYGLASQADDIIAVNKMATFGSVGVLATMRVRDDIINVTSSNAPNKRPDPRTEEGKAVIRAQLDEIEAEFIKAISSGRGVSEDKVKNDFGRGAVVLASQAKERGMIDSIGLDGGTQATNKSYATATASGPTQTRAPIMDLATLQAQHPHVYAEAVAVGRQEGVAQERERVEAHLEMGDACGDNTIAIDAIKAGDDLTNKLQAKYMAASMRSNQQNRRAQDDAATAAAADNANTDLAGDNGEDSIEAQAAAEVERLLGQTED